VKKDFDKYMNQMDNWFESLITQVLWVINYFIYNSYFDKGISSVRYVISNEIGQLMPQGIEAQIK